MAAQHQPINILRRKQVETRIGLSRSAIYSRFRPNPKRPTDYDPTFPRPISIGAKAVGWIEAEVDAWVAAQIAKSRTPALEQKPSKRRRQSLPRPVEVQDDTGGA